MADSAEVTGGTTIHALKDANIKETATEPGLNAVFEGLNKKRMAPATGRHSFLTLFYG
jgi:hypothetical protein